MPFIRTETVIQAPITLDSYVAAIKNAFANLTDCTLFDEYEDTTRRYLVFRINFSNATYGKAFIRVQITKSTLATIHSIMTGWDAVLHVLGTNNYESATSTSVTPTLTEALYIQTFDQPTNKEAKIVAITQQVSAKNFLIFVGNPQGYRDATVDNQNTRCMFFTNIPHTNVTHFAYPNNNAVLPYSGQQYLVTMPNGLNEENPSGNPSQLLTGISLYPNDTTNSITAIVAGIFSDDICICNGNNNNAGSRYVSSTGSYFLVGKSSQQVFGIRC